MPGPLPEVLAAIQQGAQGVVIDLSNLKRVTRVGIKAILDSIRLVREHRADISLVNPVPDVRRILKLNGLSWDTPIHDSQWEAVGHLELNSFQDKVEPGRVENLLIVQNHLLIARELRRNLNSHQLKPRYRLLVMRDFDQVYLTMRKSKIECLLVDSTMPLINFDAFIERIQSDRCLPQLPILIATTRENFPTAELMIRHGAHDMIKFPFDSTEIFIRLQVLISHLKDHSPYVPPDSATQPRGYRAQS